jgi:transposase
LREVPAVQILRRVWLQQFYATPSAEPMRWRLAADLPPGPLLISSPYDPDARYSKKRETEWVGYKAHVTESCDDDAPHIITNVETTLATAADNTMTGTIQAHLAARDLVPCEHIVDTSYVTSEHLVTAQDMGTDLLGPVLEDQSWPSRRPVSDKRRTSSRRAMPSVLGSKVPSRKASASATCGGHAMLVCRKPDSSTC